MEMVCRNFKHGRKEACQVHGSLTVGIIIIWVALWQLLEVISEQHLVTWEPLHWLQHVMLQGQAARNLLTLQVKTHTN